MIGLRKGVFGAGLLGYMDFGGAQAFATPGPTTDGAVCNDNVCTALCISRGYHYGICYTHSGGVCNRLYE